MPTLLISIDRTLLSLSPLVLSGSDDANALGISGYQEPAMQPRVSYAPDSGWVDGDAALSWKWQQSILGFNAFPSATSEVSARALHAELVAAVTQGLEFPVTVTVDDADPETWICNPGSVVYVEGRDFPDLLRHNAVWSVILPCHPIRS